MFLCKWHTSGCCRCFFFDLVFAGTITAPHRFHKSRLIGNNILPIHHSLWLHKCVHLCVHVPFQTYRTGSVSAISSTFVSSSSRLTTIFSPVSRRARTAWIRFFDILWPDFNTNRDAAHLCLCKFPARFVVCCIQFHSETAESVCSVLLLSQGHLLVLGNWNNNHLCRSDHWRQDKTIVVTVNHDNSTDQTGCHTPGCLMDILQFIFFICVLNAKALAKPSPKLWLVPELKGLAVMR